LAVASTTDPNLIAYYNADVVTATDYYPFGMTMPGRKYQAPNSTPYRYGGANGQEKSTEINDNSYTAEYWQYDARIGKRFNLDPKPTTGISPYATFANNPIFYTDPNGDTTYVYNQNGLLKDVILDKLTSNEIIFMNDNAISNMLGYAKNHTADEVATAARHPHNNIGRITSQTVKNLTARWTNTKAENGGVFYKSAISQDGEISTTICKDCGIADTKYGGELSVPKLKEDADFISGSGTELLGYWHTHPADPENPDGATQPSGGNSDKAIGSAIKQFEKGGIGIIVNQNSITIYPLNDVTGATNTNVDQNTTELNLFDQPYKHSYKAGETKGGRAGSTSGTATYPTYGTTVTPVKRSNK